MKAVALILLSLVAVALAAPQKRVWLDTVAQEQQKFVDCEMKHTKPECDACCTSKDWMYPGEVNGCMGICWSLPMTAPSGSR